ncbi:MAG TPA: hypothetical protein VGV18_04795, partial [Verrucomicrobiae bacterium]|nr:hypothetical protein [Verrucomicrobiae bacterium]
IGFGSGFVWHSSLVRAFEERLQPFGPAAEVFIRRLTGWLLRHSFAPLIHDRKQLDLSARNLLNI